jgi:hypothetical protein
MASVFGFATAAQQQPSKMSRDEERNHEDTPHYHFIHSMLLPSTIKIQKELRGRRFKVRLVFV